MISSDNKSLMLKEFAGNEKGQQVEDSDSEFGDVDFIENLSVHPHIREK